MRPFSVALAVVALVLALVPGWSGEARLALLGNDPHIAAERVTLDPRDPARVRVGGLTFLGGVHLTSRDPAFAGFSALTVVGNRFTLLSDGGNVASFRMGADWQPRDVAFANVPSGPRTGWEKRDRDSESMTRDPATGQVWVGFENGNAIWRFGPGLVQAQAAIMPAAMAKWEVNGGPESLVRLRDGRFVTISETSNVPEALWRGREEARWHTRDALIFAGDPTSGVRPRRFAYLPQGRYDPSDAAELPNGDLVVLDRSFGLPFHWANRLSIVAAGDVLPGKVVRGRLVAVLDAPLVHDNFEGVAVTREGADTVLWLVSDDNGLPIQRTLLLKFRLDARP